MSIEALAKISPVNPPRVKQVTKPSVANTWKVHVRGCTNTVSHENILMAVGMAITMVADEKYNLVSSAMPVTYM